MTASRVAVVTGAGRGLGTEIALQLADRGLHVVMTSRNPDDTQRLVDQHSQPGRSLEAHQLDVTDPTSVEACIAKVRGKSGRLDVLVNNAGISDGDQSALLPDLALADRVWQVNVLGAWRCARAAIPAMAEARYGRIVKGLLHGLVTSELRRCVSALEGCAPCRRRSPESSART